MNPNEVKRIQHDDNRARTSPNEIGYVPLDSDRIPNEELTVYNGRDCRGGNSAVASRKMTGAVETGSCEDCESENCRGWRCGRKGKEA